MRQAIMLPVTVMFVCALGCESKSPPATTDAAPTNEEAAQVVSASSRVEVPAWSDADIDAMSLDEARVALAQLAALRRNARRDSDVEAGQELRRLWMLVRERIIEIGPQEQDVAAPATDVTLKLPARTEAQVAAMSLDEAQTALLDLKTFLKQAEGNMDAETTREFERQWEFVKKRILDERRRDGD